MESTLYLALNDEKEHFQNFFGEPFGPFGFAQKCQIEDGY